MTDRATIPQRMISFVSDGVFSPVLDSQVVMPLRWMGARAPELARALLVLTSQRHRRNPKTRAREDTIRAALPGVKTFFRFRGPLVLPYQTRFWARKLRAALEACGYDGPQPIIVHCRGSGPAAAAALLKRRDPRLRVLLDMRGDPLDEVRHHGLVSRYLQWISCEALRVALAGADGLNTVSHRLAERLRAKGWLTRDVPHCVVGCCVDTERFRFDPAIRAAQRRELGFDGKFVVCYCGSMAFWQRPDAVADAFTAIHRDLPDAHMFIVSGEGEALVAELHRRGVPPAAITWRAATHDKVAAYLMAADVGLLLRENVPTNQVASPVKFAEYLRCGLPVILTHYVGDLAALVARENVGQAVSFPVDAAEMVRAIRAVRSEFDRAGDEYRHRCSRVAEEQLSWAGQIGKLLQLYGALAQSQ